MGFQNKNLGWHFPSPRDIFWLSCRGRSTQSLEGWLLCSTFGSEITPLGYHPAAGPEGVNICNQVSIFPTSRISSSTLFHESSLHGLLTGFSFRPRRRIAPTLSSNSRRMCVLFPVHTITPFFFFSTRIHSPHGRRSGPEMTSLLGRFFGVCVWAWK